MSGAGWSFLMAVRGGVWCRGDVPTKQALEEQEDAGRSVAQEGFHHFAFTFPVLRDGDDEAHGQVRRQDDAVHQATHARVRAMPAVPSTQRVEGQSHERDLSRVEARLI